MSFAIASHTLDAEAIAAVVCLLAGIVSMYEISSGSQSGLSQTLCGRQQTTATCLAITGSVSMHRPSIIRHRPIDLLYKMSAPPLSLCGLHCN